MKCEGLGQYIYQEEASLSTRVWVNMVNRVPSQPTLDIQHEKEKSFLLCYSAQVWELFVIASWCSLTWSHNPNLLQWSHILVTFHLLWFSTLSFTVKCPLRRWWQKFSPWSNSSQAPRALFQPGPVCGHIFKSPVLARILLSQFSQNPLPSISEGWYLIDTWLGSSSPIICQVISNQPGLPSARILLCLAWICTPPHSWCFLVIFHPQTATLLLGYKFHYSLLYSELSPVSLLHCKAPLHWSWHLSH